MLELRQQGLHSFIQLDNENADYCKITSVDKDISVSVPDVVLAALSLTIFHGVYTTYLFDEHDIRVVATTPRKDPQPNISDLRDRSQSIFRPILTRIQKKKKKKKKKLPPLYIDQLKCGIRPPPLPPTPPPPPDAFWGTTL